LWAAVVRPNHCRLDNNPFYVYGVSAGDIVEAEPRGEGLFTFVRVVEKSGNRTVRVLFEHGNATAEAKKLLETLVALGCDYEGARSKLVSVCVPPRVDLGEVERLLDRTAGLEWEHGDITASGDRSR
jgi:hypothetical protein